MLSIHRKVPLASLSTFHVGGVAQYYVEVSGVLEVSEALDYAEVHKLPLIILGGGSNILFSDDGFPGLVVRMVDGGLLVDNNRHVTVGAGIPLLEVVEKVNSVGLAGMEKLAGIPGSFGGAIRGNAGAFGMEISDTIVSVKTLDGSTGMVHEYKKSECRFSYRKSIFKENPALVIVSGELQLQQGDTTLLQRIARETMATREAKHPQNAKCAGSFFMNPLVQDEKLLEEFHKDTGTTSKDGKLPAGWLIDHVGLRGKKIGGAQISPKHPNYLINTGNATAKDIIMLASLVKTRVRDELRIRLQEEVQLVGF